MALTVAEIARLLGGEISGNPELPLTGFAPATAARAGDLTFAENADYFAAAERSAASAILVSGEFASASKTLVRVKNARTAFAKVLPLFFPEKSPAPGIHPTAIVAPSAQVDPTAYLGPYCVVGERVKIGAKVVIEALVSIGDDAVIGDETRLFPNVSVYHRVQIGRRVRIHSGSVVGSDGFGYVFDEGRHLKVPQIGNVIIQDDVELGANVTVDRAALGSTIIGKGTKIDNLVQVAHNVVIGENCIIVAQVGIAGSTKLGQYVTLGGQVGIAGHLNIGNQVTVAAQSGVMNNIPDGEKWLGAPAQPDKQTKRQMIAVTQLPDLIKRVRELEKKLEALTGKETTGEPSP